MRAMRVVAYDGDWTDEACNALFLVSICVKYAVENTSSMGIHELFEMDRTMSVKHSLSSSGSKPDDPRLELDPHVVNDKRLRSFHLLEELLHVLIYADARTPANYEFYLQTLNLLIILFSTQLNGSGAVEGEYFLEVLLGRLSHFAGGAMQRLLMNAIHRPPPLSASSGVLYSAYSYLFSSQPTKNTPAVSPVGDKSAVLYLILAAQTSSHFGNPFAEVAGRLRDSHEMPAPQITDSSDDDDNTVNVSFRNLYQTLCTGMSTPSLPKILYLLLLQNRSFRSYILSRTDPESLLIPILKQIYELHDRRDAFPTLYVLLLVLLILSQDEIWVESIQKITVSQQPWFTDRVVKQNSLGGFAVLLLIRCVQVNLAASKDAYCHVLHIAILTNLGCGLIGMSAVVAQRLVGFYDMIAKRYHRILAGFNSTQATPMQTPITTTAPALLVFPDSFDDHQGGGPDTHIYSDILAALLEIINAVFTHSLRLNPELIYAVLHSPERFTPLSHHPRFHPLVANIELVMGYFSGRVEERRGAWGGLASAQDVAGEIERGVRTWKGGGCEVYSGMKYILEVGEGTDGIGEHNFAVGYAWECAVKQACIHWQSTPLLDAFVSIEMSYLQC
ncbi:Dymeclin [Phlyctochytrium arcticum]|nr:Dymeclin [Phlyctochytrium arcticum]